jgi:acyl carrier protein
MEPTQVTFIMTAICDFVRVRFPSTSSASIDENTPLLSSGTLDSLGILELVIFLSEKFNIEMDSQDFSPENFETIGHLARFVQCKQVS